MENDAVDFKTMYMESQKLLNQVLAAQKSYMDILANKTDAVTGRPVMKHTIDATHMTVEEGLNERAFFQDCSLDSSILNFTLQPMHTLLNMIPARANNFADRSFGMMTGMGTSVTGARPVDVCDPGQLVSATYDFCKMKFPFSRFDLRIGTFEIDKLVEEVCEYIYDHFYFVGDVRGISQPPNRRLDPLNDRGLIVQGAIMRSFAEMARVFQLHAARQLWIGNPANNTAQGGYKEMLGLQAFFDDDIPNSVILSPYLTSDSGDLADCAAMNADIKVFDACVNDLNAMGYSLWDLIQEMADTLYQRAVRMTLLPVRWKILMPRTTFTELAKVLPCMVAADGCVTFGESAATLAAAPKQGTVSLTSMLDERNRLLDRQSLRIWGRDYPVEFDDAMPTTVNGTTLESGIYFIPFMAAGEELLWYEYMDYSRWQQALSGIPGSITNAMGWHDMGRFHSVITQVLRCFEIDTKTENRVIFRGTPLAGEITGVQACTIQEKPDHILAADPDLFP